MAGSETRTIIELVGGGEIATPEEPVEVAQRLTGDVGFVRVEDVDGRQHWVNPAQVTEFYEPATPAGS